jgi:hypothetical protein
MKKDWVPIRFIDVAVEAYHHEPPLLSKAPGSPDGFFWAQEEFKVVKLISSWQDFRRKGRMGKNMTPEHLRTAEQRGSWGVGRFYYRVRTTSGRVFDLYYDRAPKDAGDRSGRWILWRELAQR